jgi:hypothetical protein
LREIYDSLPTLATMRLAAALNSLLTNPSSKWFTLSVDDPELNSDLAIREWFDETANIILRVLENSNFYSEVNEMYIDLVAYGTGVLYIEPSKKSGKELNFSARPIKEIYLCEDAEGMIDTLVRKFKMTAKQMIEDFGLTKVSDKVQKEYEKNPETKFVVSHFVFPRSSRSRNKKDAKNMKYASVWIENDKKHVLRVGGYEVFPYTVSRWLKETGEKYGRGPGLMAMPDIKTLNAMARTMLMAGERIANPVLQVPDEGFSDVKSAPGSIIYYDATMKARIEPLIIGANMPISAEMLTQKREAISDAFYMNQLLLLDKRELTAEEVRARQQENARILAPTFGMLNYEFLAPLIDRIISILQITVDDTGQPILKDTPDALKNKNMKLMFISPLAKSQRVHELQAVSSVLMFAGNLANISPDVFDNVDLDKAIQIYADINGAPAAILRSPKVVANIRAVRAKSQAAKEQAAMAQQRAETVKDGSKGVQNLSKVMNQQV